MTRAVADGYGAAARPLEQVVQDVVASRKDALPILVWICDPADVRENRALEEKVFDDEKVAIPLQRFVCLQGDISSIPAGKLREDLSKAAPLVLFYDPAGKAVDRLEGGRATSLSRVYGAIDKLWSASFKFKIRDFARKMDSILDKIDRVETKLIAVEIKRRRAAGNASRLAAVDREEAKLEKEEKKLLENQTKLVADVTLREDFTSEGGESAQK